MIKILVTFILYLFKFVPIVLISTFTHLTVSLSNLKVPCTLHTLLSDSIFKQNAAHIVFNMGIVFKYETVGYNVQSVIKSRKS